MTSSANIYIKNQETKSRNKDKKREKNLKFFDIFSNSLEYAVFNFSAGELIVQQVIGKDAMDVYDLFLKIIIQNDDKYLRLCD